MPVGSFLYESARDQDPIYRLGMLHFFETKNIGKKMKRAEAFGSYGDSVSQHDMDFDWADEGIHAAFGKRWLLKLLEVRGETPEAFERLKRRCEELAEKRQRRPARRTSPTVRASSRPPDSARADPR